MNLMEYVEKGQMKTGLPKFKVGDTISVMFKITEGEKERIQNFKGIVIAMKRGLNRACFTVRKISNGVGVERIFPLHSPKIEKIEIVQRGKVRSARLYYLRDRRGKAARVKAQRLGIGEEFVYQEKTQEEAPAAEGTEAAVPAPAAPVAEAKPAKPKEEKKA
jgi:large subunit ribosomal protein L19